MGYRPDILVESDDAADAGEYLVELDQDGFAIMRQA
jgi:hypothetical protein